ncbi:MAG: flagellar protein FlaG [Gammaproteobacteria bacterium]|nr:flagellar protein FlaG [Gammaproteobacteria bacterium]MDH3448356.1 flagellar protein FlaG [Gammaproteobacteria bacterium]
MANEISSIASIRALTPAKSSGQVTKPDVARAPVDSGDVSPSRGRELPAQVSDSAEITEAVTEINEIIRSVQRDLSFNVDEDSGKTIIRVIDSESGELIRQIPSEDILAIAIQLRDFQQDRAGRGEIGQGLLFSDST